jgi:hypothetical protein
MKRSLSITSINSSDSVIPIEIIDAPTTQQQRKQTQNGSIMQTRSKSTTTTIQNNSYNSNTSLNSTQIKKISLSPCSLIYVDSETTNLSDATINGNNKNDV